MMANYTTTKRLYLTKDDRIVEEGDPAARWLFAAAGTEISEDDATKYGLIKGKQSEEPAAPPEVAEATRVVPTESIRSTVVSKTGKKSARKKSS